MTAQTKEPRAFELLEIWVVVKATQEAYEQGLLTGTSEWAAYIYQAVDQQVREDERKRLVAKAGVMPKVMNVTDHGDADNFSAFDYCYVGEVREAIAALQAQNEKLTEKLELWKSECNRVQAMFEKETFRASELHQQLNQVKAHRDHILAVNDRLQAKLEQSGLNRDAVRYRHVRDNIRDLHAAVFRGATPLMYKGMCLPTAEEIDAAIDAAMKKLGGVDTTGSNPNPPECDPRA
jgi:hypothetical protein